MDTTSSLANAFSRQCNFQEDSGYGSLTDLSSIGRSQSNTSLRSLALDSDAEVSCVLKKYEDEYFSVVDAKCSLRTLERKNVINEKVISQINQADSKEAKEIMYDHLKRHADVASMREYCQVLKEADAKPRMQKLGEKMLNDLPDTGSRWRFDDSKKLTLHCIGCDAKVAYTDDAFCLPGHHTSTGTYRNPHEYLHTTMTVTRLRYYTDQDYRLFGESTTWHTWFDGYAWTILCCAHCQTHLGRKFDATSNESDPQMFFGCTLKSFKARLS